MSVASQTGTIIDPKRIIILSYVEVGVVLDSRSPAVDAGVFGVDCPLVVPLPPTVAAAAAAACAAAVIAVRLDDERLPRSGTADTSGTAGGIGVSKTELNANRIRILTNGTGGINAPVDGDGVTVAALPVEEDPPPPPPATNGNESPAALAVDGESGDMGLNGGSIIPDCAAAPRGTNVGGNCGRDELALIGGGLGAPLTLTFIDDAICDGKRRSCNGSHSLGTFAGGASNFISRSNKNEVKN
jgi:hypothetical protein